MNNVTGSTTLIQIEYQESTTTVGD